MFDDEPQKKTTSEFPRNLENMSVAEIAEYVAELEAEIIRARADADKKQASMSAADSIFKS